MVLKYWVSKLWTGLEGGTSQKNMSIDDKGGGVVHQKMTDDWIEKKDQMSHQQCFDTYFVELWK